jgi:hypothetical protein
MQQHSTRSSSPYANPLWAVRDALRTLSDPSPLRLGHCRYARTVLPREPDAFHRGRLLQRCLRAAIAALRPCTPSERDERRWWPYRIFAMECVEGIARAEVERRLAISRATYVRAKRHGLDQIAVLLPRLLAAQQLARSPHTGLPSEHTHLAPSDIIAATLCGCIIDDIDDGVPDQITLLLDEPRMGQLHLFCGGATFVKPTRLEQHFTRQTPWERTIQWADWPTPNTLQLTLSNGAEITLQLHEAQIVPVVQRPSEHAVR